VEQYSDRDTNRSQRIPQGRGFFQLRHERMLHGSLGAVARGRPAASFAKSAAPM
jgi:hypothetical protein